MNKIPIELTPQQYLAVVDKATEILPRIGFVCIALDSALAATLGYSGLINDDHPDRVKILHAKFKELCWEDRDPGVDNPFSPWWRRGNICDDRTKWLKPRYAALEKMKKHFESLIP